MRIISILFALLWVLNVSAQEAETLWCHELGKVDGLSAVNYNFYVYCDEEDFIWVNSTNGLNRFDGQNVKQYHSNTQDSTALFGGNIQSQLFEDDKKNIWFCTYEAIHYYNRQTDEFQQFFVSDSLGNLIEEDYYVFFLEQNKYLWFRAGPTNIYRVDISDQAKTKNEITHATSLFQTRRFHAFVGADQNGSVKHIFTSSNDKSQGLEYFEIEDGKIINSYSRFDQSDKNNPVKDIFQVYHQDEENVWIASRTGIVKWNIKEDISQSFPFGENETVYLSPYNDRQLLVSFSERGLFLFDKKEGTYQQIQLKSIDKPNADINTPIRNIFVDRNRVLWITKAGEGLLYVHLDKQKFKQVPKDESKGIDYYNELLLLDDGNVLVGHNKGFSILNEKGKEVAQMTSDTLTTFEFFLKDHRSNKILGGADKGLFVFDLGKSKYEVVAGTERARILGLCQLQNGKILFSSLSGGIYQLIPENGSYEIQALEIEGGGEHFFYTTIFQGESDDIYVCRNESGIDIFSYENNLLKLKNKLPVRGAINALYEDTEGQNLWIGTSFGLVKYSTTNLESEYTLYNQESGLPDNSVYQIIPGFENKLWLSTYRGLSLFDIKQEKAHNFSLADGMLSDEFNLHSGVKLEDGTIWFGGVNGITIIPPTALNYLDKKPKILISDFKINGEKVTQVTCKDTQGKNINEVEHLEYDYKQNTFSFQFLATDYADPSATQLRYKLDEKDKKWLTIKATEKGIAHYRDLAPGDYHFLVEGLNSDGNEKTLARKKIQITINPPFWQTNWFRALVCACIIGIIVGVYQIRMRQVRKTEGLKTKIAENKMAVLIAQMNPHFIFNSLQSVNRYILKGEKMQASQYLGRFSGLIRMMLENSRLTNHTLEEEVKFLNLYMKVEAQRFKVPFDYEITIDEELDEYNTDIPTMMIQPFVENSIWHGVSHKKNGEGLIEIKIKKDEELLHCTIEDNGVGLEKAAEISAQKEKKHTSRALEIVRERLNLLFPKQKDLCSVVYTSLTDDTGAAKGTRVSIRLPINY